MSLACWSIVSTNLFTWASNSWRSEWGEGGEGRGGGGEGEGRGRGGEGRGRGGGGEGRGGGEGGAGEGECMYNLHMHSYTLDM